MTLSFEETAFVYYAFICLPPTVESFHQCCSHLNEAVAFAFDSAIDSIVLPFPTCRHNSIRSIGR